MQKKKQVKGKSKYKLFEIQTIGTKFQGSMNVTFFNFVSSTNLRREIEFIVLLLFLYQSRETGWSAS